MTNNVQVVQWTVLREAVVVSREQLAAFRALRTEGGLPLGRYVQYS